MQCSRNQMLKKQKEEENKNLWILIKSEHMALPLLIPIEPYKDIVTVVPFFFLGYRIVASPSV